MIDPIIYLKDFFFENKHVSLKGFGVFELNESKSTIHPVEHRFSPPYRKITFISDENASFEAEFIDSIASENGIHKNEAETDVLTWITQCKEELKKGNKVQLKEIGFLFANVYGKIELEQDLSINYNPINTGLSSFKSPAIKRESKVIAPPVEEHKSYKKTLIWAAVFLIFISCSFMVWHFEWYKDILPSQKTELATENEPITTEITTEDQINETVIDTTAYDSTLSANTVEEIQIQDSDSIYYVVAGLFSSKKNAVNYVKKLSNEGYNASKRKHRSREAYRVFFNTYNQRSEAESGLQETIKKYDKAWILVESKSLQD